MISSNLCQEPRIVNSILLNNGNKDFKAEKCINQCQDQCMSFWKPKDAQADLDCARTYELIASGQGMCQV